MPNRPPPAAEALRSLREGNERYVLQTGHFSAPPDPSARRALVEGQSPIAVVLGCSDSRVPVEIVFDQNLGDLFVIRVAGNIVAPSLIGSAEFAAASLGTRLIVVLGHSDCGAVAATIDEILRPPDAQSPNLGAIIARIRPNIEDLVVGSELAKGRSSVMAAAVQSNVRASVAGLLEGSAILAELVANDDLVIVGAEYSLETGRVTFVDDETD